MNDEVIEQIASMMVEKGQTLAVAESCTGGSLSEALVAFPGTSSYFAGAVVAYSSQAKSALLAVDSALLETYGAVSSEVAEAMARGAQQALHSDYAIAITGLAGPGDGGEKVPIGTVWLAIVTLAGNVEQKKISSPAEYDRKNMIAWTVQEALRFLHSVIFLY